MALCGLFFFFDTGSPFVLQSGLKLCSLDWPEVHYNPPAYKLTFKFKYNEYRLTQGDANFKNDISVYCCVVLAVLGTQPSELPRLFDLPDWYSFGISGRTSHY